MHPSPSPSDPATLPTLTFGELYRILLAETGGRPSVSALQKAGYTAGEAVFRAFSHDLNPRGERASELPVETFWARLSAFFAARGWGDLAYTRPHPGLGLVSSTTWVESAGPERSGRAEGEGCPFTTGVLARILEAVAENPIAVLQITCPSRGDDATRFVFGHPLLVQRAHARMAGGSGYPAVLEGL
jgi:hypothetical protein